MTDYIFFLGNHPALSTTELWRTLERQKYTYELRNATDRFVRVGLSPVLDPAFLTTLGGSGRVAEVLGVQHTQWTAGDISRLLPLPAQGKVRLGISGQGVPHSFLKSIGLALKKDLRVQRAIKVQFITPQSSASMLNSAQVLFHSLTKPPHAELIFIHDRDQYLLARTLQVQDIQSYALRDTERPARDPGIGMLPPKLAQMMLNVLPPLHTDKPVIYDPFCGMGTVLQEGWLLGYTMIGSDTKESMIAASRDNLSWLAAHFPRQTSRVEEPRLWQADASQAFPVDFYGRINAVVTEPYLGSPLSSLPSPSDIKKRISDLSTLYVHFFTQARKLFSDEGWIVFLLPAHARARRHTSDSHDFTLFPPSFIDAVEKLGYSLNQLIPSELATLYTSTDRGTLIYSRSDALVGREITLWRYH